MTGHQSNRPLIEPLASLAQYAFEHAEVHCDPAHDCASYHKMWSLVRLLETDGELPSGEGFFDREMPKVARDGHAKVLLSGSADTGLMALAGNALLKAGQTPHIVMVDRCATPLAQARIFATENDVQLTTCQGTLDDVSVSDVDAILAHSFLAFIPLADRPALFEAWHRALRPGGRVIMSQRLSPDGEDYVRKRPTHQIAERRERLAKRLAESNPVDATAEVVLDAAVAFWTNSLGGRSISAAELNTLCEQTGFHIESIAYDNSNESVSPFAIANQAIKRARAEIVLSR